MVIFDESHKLSAYEYGQKTYKSKRYEAAYVLSQQCEHMLLLTATPHRGRTDTFKSYFSYWMKIYLLQTMWQQNV